MVGVAQDIRASRWESEWLASFYLPYSQAPPKALGQAELLVRTDGRPAGLIPAIRHELQSVEKDLALANIKTQAEEMNEKYLGRVQPVATLLGFFAALALLLTVIGIYGVVPFAVTQRTQEIGIRMALGAQAGDVVQLVIAQGMKPVLSGIAFGMISSFALTRLLRNLLFSVSATDSLTFFMVALLVSVVALLACLVPACRATKVDPMETLRYE